MMDFSKELIEQAKACHSVEELVTLGKENGHEISVEEAEFLLQEFAEGELSDEELDNVAGGQEGCKKYKVYDMVYWKRSEDVQFLFNEGDQVESYPAFSFTYTAGCKVVSRKVQYDSGSYYDVYWLEKNPGCKVPFIKGYRKRNEIQIKGAR